MTSEICCTSIPLAYMRTPQQSLKKTLKEDIPVITSKSVVIRTLEEPERNSLMMMSRSFCSMSPCCIPRQEVGGVNAHTLSSHD